MFSKVFVRVLILSAVFSEGPYVMAQASRHNNQEATALSQGVVNNLLSTAEIDSLRAFVNNTRTALTELLASAQNSAPVARRDLYLRGISQIAIDSYRNHGRAELLSRIVLNQARTLVLGSNEPVHSRSSVSSELQPASITYRLLPINNPTVAARILEDSIKMAIALTDVDQNVLNQTNTSTSTWSPLFINLAHARYLISKRWLESITGVSAKYSFMIHSLLQWNTLLTHPEQAFLQQNAQYIVGSTDILRRAIDIPAFEQLGQSQGESAQWLRYSQVARDAERLTAQFYASDLTLQNVNLLTIVSNQNQEEGASNSSAINLSNEVAPEPTTNSTFPLIRTPGWASQRANIQSVTTIEMREQLMAQYRSRAFPDQPYPEEVIRHSASVFAAANVSGGVALRSLHGNTVAPRGLVSLTTHLSSTRDFTGSDEQASPEVNYSAAFQARLSGSVSAEAGPQDSIPVLRARVLGSASSISIMGVFAAIDASLIENNAELNGIVAHSLHVPLTIGTRTYLLINLNTIGLANNLRANASTWALEPNSSRAQEAVMGHGLAVLVRGASYIVQFENTTTHGDAVEGNTSFVRTASHLSATLPLGFLLRRDRLRLTGEFVGHWLVRPTGTQFMPTTNASVEYVLEF